MATNIGDKYSKDSSKDGLKDSLVDSLTDNIFNGLNPEQRDAVACIEGPSLIVAGAGSGKTRVLTCRIANILAAGVRPREILALTFTKKAAGEMKERIAALVGPDKARALWMGTFHSIFIRFLREYASVLGYPEQFTIYDQSDSRNVVKQCIKELNLDEKEYKPNVVQNRISLAKNNLKTVSLYRNDSLLMDEDRDSRRGRICDIYALYTEKCKAAGAMDFDDILLNMNILLRDSPQACASIGERFAYVLVDEYQDTNYAQYIILKKLSRVHRNICVVGDDSQSIYGFRGARIENILRFKKDYPDAREFRLEQNYRSTKVIVGAANSLISKNEHRLKKECFSKGEDGDKIGVIKAFTEQEEAYLISSSIVEKIYATKSTYDSFAILYRTNAQSRAIEEALRRKNLPYRIYGGHSFFERAEIKDMLAYFKLIVNPKDDEALRRVINVPARAIGETSMERVTQVASAGSMSLFEAINGDPAPLVAKGMRDGTIRKMREFTAAISECAEKSLTVDAYNLALEIGDTSGYLVSLQNDKSPENQARLDNIEELYNGIKEFVEEEGELRLETSEDGTEETGALVTLSDYLENIFLLSEAEKDDLEDAENSSNRITLMTVHASKGLEFPFVYVAGMEENLFPSLSMTDSVEKLEEERRLFYVALTRAEKCATVSYAKNRMKWGKQEQNQVSRFLKEIDPVFLEKPIEDFRQQIYSNFEDEDSDFDIVSHGYGRNNHGYGGGGRGYDGGGNGNGYGGGGRGYDGGGNGYGGGGRNYGGGVHGYGGRNSSGNGLNHVSGQPAVSGSNHAPAHGSGSSVLTAGRTNRPLFSSDHIGRVHPEGRSNSTGTDFKADPISDLRVGQRIEHDRFGFGQIKSFEGSGSDIRAIVTFDDGATKTLLLKYAKLRIVR